jgi:hypothetical protein
MASVSDIRDKRKFFILKTNHKKEDLCKICVNHKIIVAMKISCDYFIFTNLQATPADLKSQRFIHGWCRVDDPPACFLQYKDSGFVDEK